MTHPVFYCNSFFFSSSHRNMNDSGIRLTLPPVNVLAGACCRWIENWSCERSWLPVNFIMIAERSLVEKLRREKIRIMYWDSCISFCGIRTFYGNFVHYCPNFFQYLITLFWDDNYITEKKQEGGGATDFLGIQNLHKTFKWLNTKKNKSRILNVGI